MADLQDAIAQMGSDITVRTGTVAAMGSPMTVTVQNTNIPCGLIDGGGFFPRVGDVVAIIGQGDSWLCIGPIRPTGRSARYGVTAQRSLTSQTMNSGVLTSFLFDVLTDPYGFVPGGLGTANIVIPTTGLYAISTWTQFGAVGAVNLVQITGAMGNYRGNWTSGNLDGAVGGTFLLNAGATLQIQAHQNSGAPQAAINSTQIWRVG